MDLFNLTVAKKLAGGGGGGLDILATQSLGEVNVSSTTEINIGKAINNIPIEGYAYFFVVVSSDIVKTSDHAATITFYVKDGSSKMFAPLINYGFKSDGQLTLKSFPTGTQTMGIYPSVSSSDTKMNLSMYARYSATYTGTIDSNYTVYVFGMKRSSIIQ